MNVHRKNISSYHPSRIILGLFFSVILPSFLYAQNPDKILLRNYLKILESERNLSFAYVDETISEIYVKPLGDSLTLEALIQHLSTETGLQFDILNERYISISSSDNRNQIICGFLIDQNDGGRIDRASINIGDKFTVSDSSGYFELANIDTTAEMIIRRVGYTQSHRKVNYSNGCPTLLLAPTIIQLDEVMIKNIFTTGISKDLVGEVHLDPENLGILPGLIEPDVLQTIQSLPGIQSVNETVSDINIRGGTNDQNLVLWDGIKMYQTGHFFGLISAFNPYLNKQVRIIKNGSSAALGDGVSSTIDIRSDDGKTEEFTGGAGLNMINADAYFKIPISPKISLQLAGRRSITDVLKTPVFNNYFERVFRNTDVTQYSTTQSDTTLNSDENFFFYDVSGNLNYEISKKDKLQWHFLHIYNDLNYQENVVIGGNSDSKTSSLTQQSLASGINYQRSWSQKLITNLELNLSTYSLRGINFNIPNNQRVIQENDVLDTRIKLDTRWFVNSRWDYLFGYQFFESGVGNLEEVNNPVFYRYIKQVLRIHAIFAEANYTANQKLNLRLGIRGNYFRKFDKFLVEPRMALQYSFGKHLQVELLGEFKHQTATQVIDLQNDFLGVEKRRWVLSNELDIPIVESKQLSLGFNYQHTGLLLSIEGFYKYVTGITAASQGFQNQFQFIRSTGDYNVSGGEMLINYKLRKFSVWTGYTFAINQYYFKDLTPTEFPNNLDIQHALSAGINWNVGNFETSAGISWHSGKPYTMATAIVNNEIVYEAPNSSRLPNYFRADLSFRYSFNITNRLKGRLGASIWNLTNSRNIYTIYYRIDESNSIQKIEQQALKITPNLVFRVSF